uniref:Uncharacterized protein n=1 Tax=Anguilla anguilla TaxID=7936 RepID=A0A0E9RFN8_ANGAN
MPGGLNVLPPGNFSASNTSFSAFW